MNAEISETIKASVQIRELLTARLLRFGVQNRLLRFGVQIAELLTQRKFVSSQVCFSRVLRPLERPQPAQICAPTICMLDKKFPTPTNRPKLWILQF